jgi:hypothetical protein
VSEDEKGLGLGRRVGWGGSLEGRIGMSQSKAVRRLEMNAVGTFVTSIRKNEC